MAAAEPALADAALLEAGLPELAWPEWARPELASTEVARLVAPAWPGADDGELAGALVAVVASMLA